MAVAKLTEGNIPTNLRLKIVHLHEGNSSRKERKGHAYATIATLRDNNTDKVVAKGIAYCSPNDSPSRKTGRAVAVGRALKNFYQGE